MEAKVREIVAGQLGLSSSGLNDETLLQDVVQDSISLIGIVAELTHTLHIDVDPEKLNNVRTVGEAIKALAAMPQSSGRPNY